MYVTASEILIVAGLVLEFLSFINGARGILFFRKSMAEKKQKRFEEIGRSSAKKIEGRERKWLISSGLLFLGLLLQAIAELFF